jgi:NTP pyrophosphatase (non-canonical NTP hydrolase)
MSDTYTGALEEEIHDRDEKIRHLKSALTYEQEVSAGLRGRIEELLRHRDLLQAVNTDEVGRRRKAEAEMAVHETLARYSVEAQRLLEGQLGAVKRDARLAELVREIGVWNRETFPTVTLKAKAEHLRREAIELAQDLNDENEMADIFILLAGIVDYLGVDLAQAVEKKMAKNRKRKWGPPDEHGVVEHIEEG